MTSVATFGDVTLVNVDIWAAPDLEAILVLSDGGAAWEHVDQGAFDVATAENGFAILSGSRNDPRLMVSADGRTWSETSTPDEGWGDVFALVDGGPRILVRGFPMTGSCGLGPTTVGRPGPRSHCRSR